MAQGEPGALARASFLSGRGNVAQASSLFRPVEATQLPRAAHLHEVTSKFQAFALAHCCSNRQAARKPDTREERVRER